MTIPVHAATRKLVGSILKQICDNGAMSVSQYQAVDIALFMANGRKAAPINKPEGLLTAKAAAKRLAVCTKSVHRMAAKGLLTKVYLEKGNPKSLRYKAAEVAALMDGEVQL